METLLTAGFEGIFAIVGIALLVLQLWAFIDCLIRPGPLFPAAGKLTKPAWAAITGVALLLGRGGPLGLLAIVGLTASIVYLVDVRPAVRELQGGRGSRY